MLAATGAHPSWESPDGKWFYSSSKLCDGYVHIREVVWHQSHPSLPHRGDQSSSGTTRLVHTTGGILQFRHEQHSWVPSPLEKGGRPAGSTVWASPGSTASAWTTLVSTGNLLTRWEREIVLSPSYLRIRSRRWSFIHARSSLVPRFLTSRLSSHSFLNLY